MTAAKSDARGTPPSQTERQKQDPELSHSEAVALGLDRVGDAWGALVLRDAGRGLSRFEHFRVSLGIAPNILSKRLKALTDAGLLERQRYSLHPPRDEYVLTPAGRDFMPILGAIGNWADRHFGEQVAEPGCPNGSKL